MQKAAEVAAGKLRRKIISGQLEPGGQLPAIWRLAEQLHVRYPAMTEALTILRAEGYLTARQPVICVRPRSSWPARDEA